MAALTSSFGVWSARTTMMAPSRSRHSVGTSASGSTGGVSTTTKSKRDLSAASVSPRRGLYSVLRDVVGRRCPPAARRARRRRSATGSRRSTRVRRPRRTALVGAQPQHVGHARAAQVGVDEDHAVAAALAERDRRVHRGRRLALARLRRGERQRLDARLGQALQAIAQHAVLLARPDDSGWLSVTTRGATAGS